MAEVKVRKQKARHSSIVIGGIEENLLMLGRTNDPTTNGGIKERLMELCDELKRSLGNRSEAGESGEERQ